VLVVEVPPARGSDRRPGGGPRPVGPRNRLSTLACLATVERSLQRSEWRILVILGVPTFALALGVTTVSTYLPVLAEDFSDSSIVVGLLIGGQGLMALWLPLVVGSWSDRLRRPIGGRLPFIIAATPPLVVSLALLGFVHSVAAAAVVVAVFFAGYFVAYEPYRALYPDLVDNEIAGRAQSTQAIFRGLGTFLALLGGGMLISISDPLPFLAAGAIVVSCMAASPPRASAAGVARAAVARPTSSRSPSGSSTSSAATATYRRSSSPTRCGSSRWPP
jgi:Na+/melibiose symporter-like transporter